MAMLIYGLDRQIGNAQAWRDSFAEHCPDLEIRIFPEFGDPADIEYLAFMRPDFDVLPEFPNLKAMFSARPGSRPLSTTRGCRRRRLGRSSPRAATR